MDLEITKAQNKGYVSETPHAIVLQPPKAHELQHMKLTAVFLRALIIIFVKSSTRASSPKYAIKAPKHFLKVLL
jgi:hypothetical protein